MVCKWKENQNKSSKISVKELNKLMGRPRKPRKTYYACKGMDLEFKQREVDDFIFLWNEGHTFIDICKYIRGYNHDRTQNELAILIISLGEENILKPRKYGLWGN